MADPSEETTMTTTIRKIIEIDEERCDGCGNCIPSCAEGALAIIDGKARIIKDMYCDGLGACLGHCPQDALKIIEREAEDFDEEAAMAHVERMKAEVNPFEQPATLGCGCPGSAMQTFAKAPAPAAGPSGAASELGHWPVKLRLVPPGAPFLKDADLLLAADCAPAAYAGFHADFLRGRALVLACPKFEDYQANLNKLTEIFREAKPKSVTVLRMEVPCCTGIAEMAQTALAQSGVTAAYKDVIVTRQGEATAE
jgi:ferredoxin